MRKLTLLVLFAACGGETTAPPNTTTTSLTYYRDVAPIVQARCVGCHQPSGIAPFSLATFDDVYTQTARIKDAVVDKRIMPPLPPEQTNCQPLIDSRNMPDEERNMLADWIGGGAPEGDPSVTPNPAPGGPPPADELGAPTDTFDSGIEYTSTYSGDDDYRCFVVDPHLTQPTDIIATDVGYTNTPIVHHTIVFVALPGTEAQVDALDAADPGPGYTCFGGAGYPNAFMMSVGVPGAKPYAFPGGTGVRLPAGTRFVVQMHYNFLNGRGPDHPSVKMWRSPTPITEVPHGLGLSNYTFNIPAGATDTMAQAMGSIIPSTQTPANDSQAKEGLAWSVIGHMHLIGKSVRVDVLRSDGSKTCLLDIPQWNFHWQGFYRFKNPVPLHAGDRVLLECHWDNSAQNQPVIDGNVRTPTDVHFGEGSTDEMCAGGVMMTNFR
jgi:hypothetical protein